MNDLPDIQPCGAVADAQFARLPQRLRSEVLMMQGVMAELDGATNLQQACSRLAPTLQTARGRTACSLRRKYYAWVKSGRQWQTLIDRSRAGREFWAKAHPLPPEFVEHWRGLCERNQRKCKPAHRLLLREWHAWRADAGAGRDSSHAIPGYDSPPPADAGTDAPRGWGYDNLMRHKPTRFELTAVRIGRSAARHMSPLVFSTRVGLRVGQYYMLDDLWHDFKVQVMGQRKASRLLQLHAHDLYSACNFARGYKPAMENEMTGVEERLKEREVIFLLAYMLQRFGYLADAECGTTLIVEHGTAAIDDETEKLLYDLSRGRIKIERSGMEGLASFAGHYAGRGKGNYRFKASLESSGNLIHNETANTLLFPGQTGSNSRLNCPEELAGREKHNAALIRAMAALPPELAALLRLPFIVLQQAIPLVEKVHDLINHRRDHDLEGWVIAGLIAQEFRLAESHDWLPMSRVLALPDAQRAAVDALIQLPGLTRLRKQSPHEVWQAGQAQLKKLPPSMIALILGADLGREVRVDRGMIEFQDSGVEPEPMIWEAIVNGERLRDGERAVAVVNPFDPTDLYLFDARGGSIGVCPRMPRVPRDDVEGMQRAMGRYSKALTDRLAPVAKRGAAVTRQRIADARHNAQVLGGGPVTSEQKAKARALKHHEGSTEDFITAEPQQLPVDTEPEGSAEGLL